MASIHIQYIWIKVPQMITIVLIIFPLSFEQELINDPLYIGLKHKRIRGQAYDDLLDEFMEAAVSR